MSAPESLTGAQPQAEGGLSTGAGGIPVPPAPVLLVDDHRENLLALEAVLLDLGQPLVRAASGEEALKRVLGEDFAAILLDVQMPGLDGFETAALIRQRERSRSTPLLFLTAINKADPFVFKGYSLGAVDYIFKPFVPEVLRAKVHVFVELFQKTELLRVQSRRLAEANAELRRSNAELEQFAGVASHDLREPLRKVSAFSDLLAERCAGKLDDTERRYLELITDATSRMQSLIGSLLEFARTGHGPRVSEAVPLQRIVSRVVADLAVPIRETGAVVRVDSLPLVSGDPNLLTRLLQNLLANALKFHGPQPPMVRVSARRQGADWLVSVKDNGIGIDASDHDRIFALFKRLHGRERYPGAGIGLAVCRKVVEYHQGRIWVDSEPGRGADFRFTLPACEGGTP